MSGKRRRRNWDAEEKRRIVAHARVPGVSVAQVARRYDVNANLVFKWLKDPRYGPAEEVPPVFLPVAMSAAPSEVANQAPELDGRIEIVLSNGHRLSVEGSYDPEALARLVRGLAE